jgi:hypothetical protein
MIVKKFLFLKLTILTAPSTMAPHFYTAAPCMAAPQEDDMAPVARALAPPVAPPCMAPHCGAVDHGGDIGPLRAFVEVRTKLEP